jgi:hypothetical protein
MNQFEKNSFNPVLDDFIKLETEVEMAFQNYIVAPVQN